MEDAPYVFAPKLKKSGDIVKEVHETLAAAEEALLRAEAVRLAAFHAVEKAREAVSLKAAGVAAELLLHAAEVAANAVKVAEVKALEAWEAAAARSLKRSIGANKAKSGAMNEQDYRTHLAANNLNLAVNNTRWIEIQCCNKSFKFELCIVLTEALHQRQPSGKQFTNADDCFGLGVSVREN